MMNDILNAYNIINVHATWPSLLKAAIFVNLGVGIIATFASVITKLNLNVWRRDPKYLRSSPEYQQKIKIRRAFAEHLRDEIRRLNRADHWQNELFAELEADVEIDGRHRVIKRVSSLNKALKKSKERLILLEGEPGSGKSVALRHVAFELAQEAANGARVTAVLPVYANLRELTPAKDETINSEHIRNFVIKCMRRPNDKRIPTSLKEEFDNGMANGSWLFLFDSFDEIPEVLSSIETDEIIIAYSKAINDFFLEPNRCRGIVASRTYRRPRRDDWSTIKVQALTPTRQREVVERLLSAWPERQSELFAGLALASDDVRAMAGNPMFLSLICAHVQRKSSLPETAYAAFDGFVEDRFASNSLEISRRFNLKSFEVRHFAEIVAFAMNMDLSIGLSPRRSDLLAAINRLGFNISPKDFENSLAALQYTSLGRQQTAILADQSELEFSFAHRRLQEYFATDFVVQRAEAVFPDRLLFDARWRETAVVLCQTGRPEAYSPIIVRASEKLLTWIAELPLLHQDQRPAPELFPWPHGASHVLSILQSGLTDNGDVAILDLRSRVDVLLASAYNQGDLLDKKLVLEVAAAGTRDRLKWFLSSALSLDSDWINEVVFRQAARLSQIDNRIAWVIRKAIVRLSLSNEIGRSRSTLRAFEARLPPSSDIHGIALYASLIPPVDIALSAFGNILFMFVLFFLDRSEYAEQVFFAGALILSVIVDVWWRPILVSFWTLRLTAMLRIMPPLWGNNNIENLAIIAYIILIAWAPSALICARVGEGLRPLLWPAATATAIFFIARRFFPALIRKNFDALRSSIQRIALHLFKNRKVLLLLLAPMIPLLFSYELSFSVRRVFSSAIIFIDSNPPVLFGACVLLFFGGFGVSGIIFLLRGLRWLYKNSREKHSVHSFLSMNEGKVTGELLAEKLSVLRQTEVRMDLLKKIRKEDLLKPSTHGELALRKRATSRKIGASERDEIFRLAEQLNQAARDMHLTILTKDIPAAT